MEQEVHIHGYGYVLGVILQYGHTVSFSNDGAPTHTPGRLSFCSDIYVLQGKLSCLYMYIQLATISDMNIIQQMYSVPGQVATISEWSL